VRAPRGDNRVVNVRAGGHPVAFMRGEGFLYLTVCKQRRITPFARSQKVNGQNLPFASTPLYSVRLLPLASLRSS
jgi:hypothetical protein